MSLYAKENVNYFNQAFSSIWYEQTLKPDQIVLVKDGQLTPELDQAVIQWKSRLDDKLTIVSLTENLGLGCALNEGLRHCKYDIVARMDTDDVSLYNRFEKQIDYMQNHPDIAASSAALEEWDGDFSKLIGLRRPPHDFHEVLRFAKLRSPLNHAVAVYRKSIILGVGGYPAFNRAQDYALWSLLLCKGYKMSNLPDVLYKMRLGNLIKKRGFNQFRQELSVIDYQRRIGFINPLLFFINICIRFVVRCSPKYLKQIFYRLSVR